ncbi:hypothetical protein SADUNF_Sadunf09G0046500 [Salix dunnii]|uniref:Uncharacterized protein n=1 Tax=Salix dunnii TaxID=1413687 RepID=A0A835MW19_9ROSI|nr:hypothetical protein SADUNF_Sadunf09G0046500 [Salix dunnii]
MVQHVKMQQQVQVSMSCHQSQFPTNPNPDLHQKQILSLMMRFPLGQLKAGNISAQNRAGWRPKYSILGVMFDLTSSYLYLRMVIGRRPISPQKDCPEVPLGKGYLMPEVVWLPFGIQDDECIQSHSALQAIKVVIYTVKHINYQRSPEEPDSFRQGDTEILANGYNSILQSDTIDDIVREDFGEKWKVISEGLEKEAVLEIGL